jgi:hypothetical protein
MTAGLECNGSFNSYKFNAAGVATGPIAGTFSEGGVYTFPINGAPANFHADFTIFDASGNVIATGSKDATGVAPVGSCTTSTMDLAGPVVYTATFTAGGTDSGTATVDIAGTITAGGAGSGAMTETFHSDQASSPTNKDQCKNGGWRQFTNPAFRNQGQCVSFVASGH